MNDYDFLKTELGKRSGIATLTTYYNYKLDKIKKNLTLRILKKGLKGNMQDDESAFESWAIILKFYLGDFIDTVTIDWDDFTDDPEKNLHYNRFVYRLSKFIQTYDWVRTDKAIPNIPSILYCNCPNGNAANTEKHKKDSEGWIECKFIEKYSKDYDVINHQLPVGIFYNKVSRTTHYTTGQKSAIDIWAIKNGDFYMFELKKPSNNPLGIISEVMFYTNIINDILSHRIRYQMDEKTRKAIKENYRGFSELWDVYSKGTIKKINAILLAYTMHPLITQELIDFINNSARFKFCNIQFSKQEVDI